VAQYQTGRCSSAAAYHVLVAATNIGRHYFKYNTVVALPVANGQFGIIYFAYFNLSGFYVRNTVILTHN
jgi:hypothetical protein